MNDDDEMGEERGRDKKKGELCTLRWKRKGKKRGNETTMRKGRKERG
jgi:hypothetical protein